MMSDSGIVIRLIDVVLILLFGFISISEIGSKSPVDLPKSEQMAYTMPDKESIILIGISTEGKFLIGKDLDVISEFDALENYILIKQLENQKRDIKTKVRIQSSWNTPVKYTLAVANLCDSLNIPKAMDVILQN